MVAAQDLAAGEPITASDLRVVTMGQTAGLRAIQPDEQDLILGRAPRAAIPAGTVLNSGLFVAPADVTVGTDAGACTAVVAFDPPTVGDNCAGIGAPQCVPPSGSTFDLGTTGVACSVVDAAGNAANDGLDVTVFDDDGGVAEPLGDVVAGAEGDDLDREIFAGALAPRPRQVGPRRRRQQQQRKQQHTVTVPKALRGARRRL